MSGPILETFRLGPPPWPTFDPFLFCVHHRDAYPAGVEDLGPDPAALRGRELGMDFSGRDGWSMYHGQRVPGFPEHPHRGFETITLARQGLIDHSDSLGATARFGRGDAQWMTAGRGIVHSEMFPLIRRDGANPAELFQLWLNLPAASKRIEPFFTMFWSETIPRFEARDDAGRRAQVTVVAGALEGHTPPAPPPGSWAADPDHAVAVWTIQLEPEARWTLPAADPRAGRTLYAFAGERLRVGGVAVDLPRGLRLDAGQALELVNGAAPAELLLLQGRPIAEPVAHHGPFVMNTRAELVEAFQDYQRTGFGGWPWADAAPVHPREAGRFAVHADGRRETPPQAT